MLRAFRAVCGGAVVLRLPQCRACFGAARAARLYSGSHHAACLALACSLFRVAGLACLAEFGGEGGVVQLRALIGAVQEAANAH